MAVTFPARKTSTKRGIKDHAQGGGKSPGKPSTQSSPHESKGGKK